MHSIHIMVVVVVVGLLSLLLSSFFLSFFLSLVRIVGVVDHPQEEGGAERSPLALTKKKKSLKRYTSQPPKTLL